MRTKFGDKLEAARLRTGEYGSEPGERFGAFELHGPTGAELLMIADAGGRLAGELGQWEHVSVSTARRIPNWHEMNFVKNLFWDEEEAVLQFHAPRSRYVNCHPYCLHLWRPVDDHVRLPPMILVGAGGNAALVKLV
jgi:hypothetical protein